MGVGRLTSQRGPATPRRLVGTSFGRIVFTRQALPAIRPINHIVDNGAIIVRTHLGAAVLTATGMVVAYEADDIDPETHVGWSGDDLRRYEQLLRPWVNGHRSEFIRIHLQLVSGYQLTPETGEDRGSRS